MKKILTGSAWREADQYILERDGLSIHELVDRVAMKFCAEMKRISSLPQGIVYVFAGPGNNGADGLAITRQLLLEGRRAHCYLFQLSSVLSPACEMQRDKLLALRPDALTEVIDQLVPPILDQHSIVIDALFGTGLTRPLEGGFASLVQYINHTAATILSVDIPSGLFDENNSENNLEGIIQAHYTLTCETPKVSFLLSDNEAYVGNIRILPLDLGYEQIPTLTTDYYLYLESDCTQQLRRPSRFAHKGTMGHALLMAGSQGMIGSAILGSLAALRTGVGKLSLHLPHTATDIIHTAVPEAIVSGDPDDKLLTKLPQQLHEYDAIACGPGIGTAPITIQLLEQLLQLIPNHCPLLLDADAINSLAIRPELLSVLPEQTILTPHPLEFDRLSGGESIDALHRLTKAREMAMEYNIIIHLKGGYSATCIPSGEIYFNSSGNAALATAGSGDVLSGIILSLLAQGYTPITATTLGAYLHGLAADLYVTKQSGLGMIARDIIDMLPTVLRQVEKK